MIDHGPQLSELQAELTKLKLELDTLVCALILKDLVNHEDLEDALNQIESARELAKHLEEKYGN